jgi:ABC-type antimicrobial peptide transport system permease subunit
VPPDARQLSITTIRPARSSSSGSEGATMAAIGLVVGGLAAIPLSRMLTGLLFGVEPIDPPTIALSAVLLIAVALVAAWIPARAATAVDPINALRGE